MNCDEEFMPTTTDHSWTSDVVGAGKTLVCRLLVKVLLAIRLVPILVIAFSKTFVTDTTPEMKSTSQQKMTRKREDKPYQKADEREVEQGEDGKENKQP